MLSKIKENLRKKSPKLTQLYKKITAKKWPKNSIVIYTGNRKQELAYDTLQKGASGSYTAVIKLSQEWAKMGYQVTIYSPCKDKEGIYEGVEYKNYYLFNPQDTFDILIIFQHPYIMPLPIKARKVCFEWQDILGEERVYPPEKLKRFDLIFAKCQYQRNLMPFIPDEKFVIATNGIDPSIAELNNTKKEPYKLIYASRYYRGLEAMLTYGWPIIKKEIPEAELHIYYGFVRRELGPSQAQWRAKMLELMQQDGVFEHGLIGQDKLILEKASASIHYYACTYPEIDCISVRESAMVGCVPVTTDLAVMAEKDYCVTISGEPESQETQEKVAHKIVELLKNPEELETIRQDFIEKVKHETWENVTKIWTKNFE
jgi:glycosyltransferase involved in cell wall biosynthesis